MIGRLMALDFGTKRIGVALSDPLRVLARGWGIIARAEGDAHLEAIRKVAEDEQVAEIVIGLPRNADGSEGPMATAARDFGAKVGRSTGLPVHFTDESYSSLEADEILREKYRDPKKRKAERDIIAAQIILRHYLEFGC